MKLQNSFVGILCSCQRCYNKILKFVLAQGDYWLCVITIFHLFITSVLMFMQDHVEFSTEQDCKN